MGNSEKIPGPNEFGLRSSISAAAARVESVIEAAEKAAAGMLQDAEAQATRYLEQAKERADRLTLERVGLMSELTDALVERANIIKRQSDELISSLDEATRVLSSRARDPGSTGPLGDLGRRGEQYIDPFPAPGKAQPPPGATQQSGSVERRSSAPDQARAPQDSTVSDGARLLATQMAVAGSSRAEIEERLRHEFGIEDASAILEGETGPENA